VGSDLEIPVDVRIIAATNRELAEQVKQGSFRQDLYYRLDVMNIHIPPLRERQEDIAPLARHFMQQLATKMNITPLPVAQEQLAKMRDYPWPGNARELRNVIERALILGHIPDDCFSQNSAAIEPVSGEAESLQEVEKRHILSIMAATSGNKTEAARRLNISRKTLERKYAEWGIQQ